MRAWDALPSRSSTKKLPTYLNQRSISRKLQPRKTVLAGKARQARQAKQARQAGRTGRQGRQGIGMFVCSFCCRKCWWRHVSLVLSRNRTWRAFHLAPSLTLLRRSFLPAMVRGDRCMSVSLFPVSSWAGTDIPTYLPRYLTLAYYVPTLDICWFSSPPSGSFCLLQQQGQVPTLPTLPQGTLLLSWAAPWVVRPSTEA